jgi:TonB family protein
MKTRAGWIALSAVLANAPVDAAEPAEQAQPAQSPEQDEYPVPIVMTCINAKAKILSVEIVQSSGYPDIDNAALKVARNTKYAPGTSSSGRKQKKSCVKFKVRFVIMDGEQFPVEIAPPPVTSRT